MFSFSGSGSFLTRGEERAREYETRPSEADQNAGVRSQTGEVRQSPDKCSPRPLFATHSASCPSVLHVFGIVAVCYWDIFLCLLFTLPPCGLLFGCRAKHQKLKTGNDQSPGDKKPETEADQRKFNQAHVLINIYTYIHILIENIMQPVLAVHLGLFSSAHVLLLHHY